MSTKSWGDLDPRLQLTLMIASAVDSGLKVAALTDLARRTREDIRGSKTAWGWALALVNSAGVLPVVYLLRGRRPTAAQTP